MIEAKKYNTTFFSEMEKSSYKAATIILPIIHELIEPQSVADIGCGTGMWLKVWNETLGISDYLGVEGPYLSKDDIKVDGANIYLQDLKQPLDIDRRFDLAMSLEVAEHLPEAVALPFVTHLTTLSDVILFSAAIPGQVGTYHINEQYPEYWVKHFKSLGYTPLDFIRDMIWHNEEIEFWYRQNTFLFVKEASVENYPKLLPYLHLKDQVHFTRIHPIIYHLKLTQVQNTTSLFGYLNWRWYKFKRKYLFKNAS